MDSQRFPSSHLCKQQSKRQLCPQQCPDYQERDSFHVQKGILQWTYLNQERERTDLSLRHLSLAVITSSFTRCPPSSSGNSASPCHPSECTNSDTRCLPFTSPPDERLQPHVEVAHAQRPVPPVVLAHEHILLDHKPVICELVDHVHKLWNEMQGGHNLENSP